MSIESLTFLPKSDLFTPFLHKDEKDKLRTNETLNEDRNIHSPPLGYSRGGKTSLESSVNYNKKNKMSKSMTQEDLAAMSVLSLMNSDNIDKDMDTTRDDESGNPSSQSTIEVEVNDEASCSKNIETNESCLFNDGKKFNDKTKSNLEIYSLFECSKPTIYFNDGRRSVDFVLVWDSMEVETITDEAQNRRALFEANLLKEGLELEYEPVDSNGLHFLKIHAPQNVLRFYSDVLKLRLPMKEILGKEKRSQSTANYLMEQFNLHWKKVLDLILIDVSKFPEKKHRFTAIYSRDKEYLFDVDAPCFFTPAIHSRIIQFILDRKRFSDNADDDFAFGIERLLNENVYTAAYPLHDGNVYNPGCMRNLLYREWASICKWYRYQPLDYVKEYFGVKIALYFAWLGFYTHMLLPASVVGLICFLYSCLTLYTHVPSKDICGNTLNFTMCPQCEHYCEYWNITTACLQSRITYLFDNSTTVFFAIFMSIWAAIFLEFWKRYSSEITHRWDLTGFDVQEEHPRPQYLARLSHVKQKQINIVTNTMEPHVPFWKMRVPATVFSFSIVLLLVALAFATVAAVILYRISVLTALHVYGDRKYSSSHLILFTTVTAACINLVCIIIFNWLYTRLAEYLTELEFLRTQTQFDDSLTLKIYLLQFVNYYASIFYIAFFKGKFIGYPKRYVRFFGYRQEECPLGGCLMELCIQLAIIMVGKQALNSVLEMLFPLFYKWMNTLKIKTRIEKSESSKNKPQWVKDFKLVMWGPRSLFPEYLEMVLQYGFVTIFVAAFPLAPVFALLNNILEMRLDARKLLVYYRRPVTQRVKDIGVWYRILDSIGKLSVITNGLIIAFTSNFIPHLVYRMYVSKHFSLKGYVNYSLSVFNTTDFENPPHKSKNYENTLTCRYPDFREPPGKPNEYQLNLMFWHILAARLAFVVIFENVVASIIILVKWLIPDVPGSLLQQIRRENFITNEIILQQETLRAKESCHPNTAKDDISPPIVRKYTLGQGACPTTASDWDQIIDKSLSGSNFDLMDHDAYPNNLKEIIEEQFANPTPV